MEQFYAEARDNGVLLVGISMGEPKHTKRYCGKLAPNVICLVREDTAGYEAYGLQQGGMRELMSFDVGKAIIKTVSLGHTGGKPIGDARMMPGTFVVDEAGIIQFAHYNDHIADHSDLAIALTTLKSV